MARKSTTRSKSAGKGAAPKKEGVTKGEPAQSDLDSVRMYLSKIGCVDLLTREQEVEIAKRIEEAREAVLAGILSTQAGVNAFIELPRTVRRGLKSLREVLDGSSNQEPDPKTGLVGLERFEAVAKEMKSVARARLRSARRTTKTARRKNRNYDGELRTLVARMRVNWNTIVEIAERLKDVRLPNELVGLVGVHLGALASRRTGRRGHAVHRRRAHRQ